jgi:hypothetical protein
MTSVSGPEHLSSHHRLTVEKILQHPAGHNIEWHDVLSLLEAVGTVTAHHDGRVEVSVGGQTRFLDVPAHKDIDTQAVVELRHLLGAAGYRLGE